MSEALIVFTGRGVAQILEEGGSQAWALNARRARKCEYLVCVQNHPGEQWARPEAPQGVAFLAGRISGVELAGEEHGDNRWIIEISEYAELDFAGLWKGWRNPVKYMSNDEIGFDPEILQWHKMPKNVMVKREAVNVAKEVEYKEVAPLSIVQAKHGLAAYFGVDIDAIDITIRG